MAIPVDTSINVSPRTGAGSIPITSMLSIAILLLMVGYCLMPLAWLIIGTTKSTHQLFTVSMFGFPHPLNFVQNFEALSRYGGGEFWRWMLNSAIYSSAVGVGSTMLGAMVGYVLAKFSFRGRAVLFWAVLSALMVPQAVLVIPIFIVESSFHLVDSYLGLILAMLVNPFAVYFMSVYIEDAVPSDIIEAAAVDGASYVRSFFGISLRMMVPGMVTLLLIAFVGTWNNFFLPLVLLSNSKLFPTTVGLNLMLSLIGANPSDGGGPALYPLIMMGAFISIVPMLILFPLLRRYITSGLALGSVKG